MGLLFISYVCSMLDTGLTEFVSVDVLWICVVAVVVSDDVLSGETFGADDDES